MVATEEEILVMQWHVTAIGGDIFSMLDAPVSVNLP